MLRCWGVVSVLMLVSCTQAIEDYYGGGNPVVGEESVFEYLQSRPDCSEFVKLIEETGMTEVFSGEDLVTIWAPKDANMPAEVAGMSDAEKLRLVRNHISITTIFSRNLARLSTVGTMAGKCLTVAQSEEGYSLDGVALLDLDRAFRNGVVHRTAEWLLPRKNLYQWVSELGDDYSRFRDTLFAHNVRVFDRENSPILGVDEQGRIVYDSVWVVKNDLLNDLDLNEESIRYTLFAPDNAALEQMFKEKEAYLESIGREVLPEDADKWMTWMMQAALHRGIVEFQPAGSFRSVLGRELRSDYQTVSDPVEMSNGRVYPMSRCYVPRSIYFSTVRFNPYYLRKEIIDNGGNITKNPGTYDFYEKTINNVNSRLVPEKEAVFLQYTTNFNGNYYQFKSCVYDETEMTNTLLPVIPGKYRVRCHLVSYTFNNPNGTDALDVYQVHGDGQMTLIGHAQGIMANVYDDGGAPGTLTAEYEFSGKYEPLELRIVIPGSYTAGEKRRICVGEIVLEPTDNY